MKKRKCYSYKKFKTGLNHGLVLKKVHEVIKFNWKAWLKSSIDLNTYKKNAKNDFKKDFFNVMKNTVLGKAMENMRKHRDMKPVTTEARRNYC